MSDSDRPASDHPASETPQSDGPAPMAPVVPPEPDSVDRKTETVEMPVPPVPPVPPPSPVRRGAGSVLLLLLGGALAVGAGFALSHYNLLKLRAEVDPVALDARFAALETAVKTGVEEAKAAAATPAADPHSDELASRLAAVEEAVKAAPAGTPLPDEAVARLQAEIDALKAAPAAAPADPEALQALVAQELSRALDARAASETEAEAAQAEAARQTAAHDTALLTLREAIVSGAPYAAALEVLALPEVPPVLAQYAESGLPTLAALQEGFPEAARSALDAALRAEAGDGVSSQLWSFLRIQTGARSLTPQEGDDPDAVLSRAEAKLTAGDVAGALTELAALPPEGRSAMADWTARAEARVAAETAIAGLAAPTAP